MCYVTAKHHNHTGSIALDVSGATDIEEYIEALTDLVKGKNIQVLLVSDFDVYAEYKPVSKTTVQAKFEYELGCLIEKG